MTERDDSITATSVTSQQLLQAVKGFIAETVTPHSATEINSTTEWPPM